VNVRIALSSGSFGRVRIALAAVFLVMGTSSGFAGEVSRPAGFVRVSVPAYGRAFLAMPFTPFASGLGSTSEPAIRNDDVALRWNPTAQTYELVSDPATLSLAPGEGFWIENRADGIRTLALGGWVVLDDDRSLSLQSALNAVGYPFSSGQPDWLLGQGYWAVNQTSSEIIWSFPRPYANGFPDESSEMIRITDIEVDSQSATLHIHAPTLAGETVSIFSQDMVRDEALDTAEGWIESAAGLSVGKAGELEWVDLNCEHVPGRVYVVSTGVAMEGGGLTSYMAPGESTAPQNEAGPVLRGTELADSDGDGVTDLDEVVRGTDPHDAMSAKATFFVDATSGRDTNLGRFDSPLLTIGAAMRWIKAGDAVRVAGGTYREDVDISGVEMEFVLDGDVVLEEAKQ
jgi:hypothetical protein